MKWRYSNFISGNVNPPVEIAVLKRYLYSYVHCSIIHNSKEVETTQVSSDGWMDKENVSSTYSGILFNLKKERNSNVWYNMDESWGP